MQSCLMSYDERLTGIVEVDIVLKSRQQSYVSADDLEEPLTPSHLMIGHRVMNLPDHLCTDVDDIEMNPTLLSKRARYLNTTLNRFLKRWSREYLLESQECHHYGKGDPNAVPVSVGDIVVVHNENHPRGFCKVVTGQDARTRGAVL